MERLSFRIQRNNNLNIIEVDDISHIQNGVNHNYFIKRADNNEELAQIFFQLGARKIETSLTGVLEGDLLEIVRHRLQAHQKTEYATRENACALTHIEEALMWLNKRQEDRAERGVLGTNNK